MKFLCVPCDTPMKLQSVGPPERGSLSVVYSCPECGYEMAMLTNAYETQVVQSLGVRIGPSTPLGAGPATDGAALGTSASGCPFSAMMPGETRGSGLGARDSGKGDERPGQVTAPEAVRWTAAAEARLANIPEFIRPMARTGIERFAKENGTVEIDEKVLDAAREFFGM
jgi:hypothetical protein